MESLECMFRSYSMFSCNWYFLCHKIWNEKLLFISKAHLMWLWNLHIALQQDSSSSPRAIPESSSTPLPSNVGLKAVRVSKEASTVRAAGPPTNMKKPAVTKLKAPLVSTPVPGRGGVKMSPIKGEMICEALRHHFNSLCFSFLQFYCLH